MKQGGLNTITEKEIANGWGHARRKRPEGEVKLSYWGNQVDYSVDGKLIACFFVKEWREEWRDEYEF
jgi:hypothetical protein